MSAMTRPELEAAGPIAVDCSKCRVAGGTPCRNRRGYVKTFHKARQVAHRALCERTVVTWADKRQAGFFEPKTPAPDTADAVRYLRNLTFGIVDDTLEPAAIIQELVDYFDHTVDAETHADLERERDTLIDDAVKADKALRDAQHQLAEMTKLYDAAAADAALAREVSLDLERQLSDLVTV